MTPNDKSPIKNKVRELRTAAGLTQEALGQKVGVSRVTINCLENCVYLPSIELAFRLARFFQKPIEDIFSLEENG